MGDIPSEERRVIDELVVFWHSRYEPRELIIHIDRLSSTWGSGIGVDFFRQVYQDLRTNKRGKYAVSSTLEFRQFLETEFHMQAKIYAERQAIALAKAKAEAERIAQEKARERQEREERERRAKEDIDILESEFVRAYTPLFKRTGASRIYENHCWNCYGPISSAIQKQCDKCGGYFCSNCGACLCGSIAS